MHLYGEDEPLRIAVFDEKEKQIQVDLSIYENRMLEAFRKKDEKKMDHIIHELAQELLVIHRLFSQCVCFMILFITQRTK